MVIPEKIFSILNEADEWLDIYNHKEMQRPLMRSHSNLRNIWEDLQINKSKGKNYMESMEKYLKERGNPEEYDAEELQEKFFLLDWIASQLCFQRPIKTKQLFIYGPPSTQKTLFINILENILKVYFVSSRRGDFSGAHNFYDLWVFDKFHEPDQTSGLMSSTESGTAYANTLLKVLDRQTTRLDSKYQRVFTKRGNVPIIMIANKLPASCQEEGPFQERLMLLYFSTNLEEL